MKHYICTGGCNGVSEDPAAICQATDCKMHTRPLIECDCTDGSHNLETSSNSENE